LLPCCLQPMTRSSGKYRKLGEVVATMVQYP
jgi:hypothetical protein